MKYCKKCVLPDTKPDLIFDKKGVCNGCLNYQNRKTVDWAKRREELGKILEKYRSKNGENWDCVIPVSGGKDSTFQVFRMLELGMNPLCVTATTCHLSEIGRKNIENLKRLGVDYVEFTTNPAVRRKLNKIGLSEVGDISWPEHVSIFTVPVQIAVKYKIPLIIWGENPQHEYGGPAAACKDNVLTRRWLEEFGGLLGLRVSDLVGVDGLERKQLLPFIYPSDKELKEAEITGLFLGYYFPWDGYGNSLLSQALGFNTYHTVTEGSIINYENLDNLQSGIHEYFMYLKYGFGRGSAIASLHIRRGRMTRGDAVKVLDNLEGKFPKSYLGVPLEDILKPIGFSVDEFKNICDRFTNKKIFKTDGRGDLVRDENGNLIKLFPLS
ncbi:MAG: N-acetyl sugar amidotransferase [Candidatus Paceibacterota bacterium]